MPVEPPRRLCRPSAMTRLMLGRTLERICKAVLLLCLLHFLIMMILYFDVYSQRFDLFSRFNNIRNGSRNNISGAAGSGHHYYYYNLSRPNATLASYLATGEQLVLSMQPETNQTPSPKPLPPCPENPPGLVGRLLIEFSSQMTMERVQKENPNVTEGGRYSPPDCRPRWKVAIIIPFRHRENHLKYWLHYLHPILRRQKIDYGIYIINQAQSVMKIRQQPFTVQLALLLSTKQANLTTLLFRELKTAV